MPSDQIEDLLKADFDAAAEKFERDRFAARMLFKLGARRRARLGVVALAGGFGAAFAASQFMEVVTSLAPALGQTAPDIAAAGFTPHLFATLILGGALATTALVLRHDF